MTDLAPFRLLFEMLWGRLQQVRSERTASLLRPQRRGQWGYSTEAVVVTAALAALAIAVTGIIVYKVTQQANSIATK